MKHRLTRMGARKCAEIVQVQVAEKSSRLATNCDVCIVDGSRELAADERAFPWLEPCHPCQSAASTLHRQVDPSDNSIMAKKQAQLPRDAGIERCETVSIELTDSERIEYRKAAERCGLSLSEWIRDRLNEALKREAKEA